MRMCTGGQEAGEACKRYEGTRACMHACMHACVHACVRAGQRAHTHELLLLPAPPLHPHPMRVLLPSYSPFRSPQPPSLLLSREWSTRTHSLRTHMHTHSLTTRTQRVASPENKLEHGCLSKIKVLLDDGLPARQVCIVTFATRLLRLEHHGVRKTFVRKTSVTSQRLIRSCSMTSCRRGRSLVTDESFVSYAFTDASVGAGHA